jgi:hypothetical protein
MGVDSGWSITTGDGFNWDFSEDKCQAITKMSWLNLITYSEKYPQKKYHNCYYGEYKEVNERFFFPMEYSLN